MEARCYDSCTTPNVKRITVSTVRAALSGGCALGLDIITDDRASARNSRIARPLVLAASAAVGENPEPPALSDLDAMPLDARTRRALAGAALILILQMMAALPATAGDRLLATGGITEIEGSAGGGITPWALIAGLETEDQTGGSAACTRVKPQDFRLDSCALALGIGNRLELSAERMRFDLGNTVPGQSIRLEVFGAKVRLFGDAVFDQDRWWPQIAVGVQWKHNEDFDLVPKALGASHADGADFYVAATKVWLDGPLAHTWLADVTLRASEANQLGILGFGGDRGGYHLLAEGSVGVFVTDHLIAGAEYRQKPSNLSAFREDDFRDLFVALFPLKYLAVTAAFADLGNIAGKPGQRGYYLSLQGCW
jgi:hypothetical protein